MNRERLERLLREVKSGKASIASAPEQLRSLPSKTWFCLLGSSSFDPSGISEVILCEGKTPAQIRGIAGSLLKHHRPFLATRATRDIAAVIKRIDRRAVYHESARIVAVRDAQRRLHGRVLVITAGTSDVPAAEEARITAKSWAAELTRFTT